MEEFVEECMERLEMYDDDPFLLKVVKWLLGLIFLTTLAPICFYLYIPIRGFLRMISVLIRGNPFFYFLMVLISTLFTTALLKDIVPGLVLGPIVDNYRIYSTRTLLDLVFLIFRFSVFPAIWSNFFQ